MAESQKILVADDDPRIAMVLNEYFTRLGYTVLIAKTGKETLERVEKDHPALVLLDITMPDMHGTEILRQIKARAPAVEVIMLTGSKDRVIASKSLALGARDYITKPVDLAYLERSVVTQLLGRPSAPADAPPVARAEVDPGAALAEIISRTRVPTTPTPAAPEEPMAPPAPASAEVDPGVLLAELLSRSSAITSMPAATPEPTPKAESAVALATECFRLADGLAPPGLARGIEECALWVLEAVATGSDRQPHLNMLRLYLEVAQRLGSLTVEKLIRLDALCRDLEEGSAPTP